MYRGQSLEMKISGLRQCNPTDEVAGTLSSISLFKESKTADGGKHKRPARENLFYLCYTPKHVNP